MSIAWQSVVSLVRRTRNFTYYLVRGMSEYLVFSLTLLNSTFNVHLFSSPNGNQKYKPWRSVLSLLHKLASNRLNEEEEDVFSEAVGKSNEVGLGNQSYETIESRALLERDH